MAVWRLRTLCGICVALSAFVGCYGFAASFAAGTGGLGAGSEVVASCGSGMMLSYTTVYDAADAGHVVSSIGLSHIPVGCLGKSLVATFSDDAGTGLGSPLDATLPASGTTQRIDVTPNPTRIDAGQVSEISVAVS